MKVAVVVQRYGADINGGAELHARYVAEHLARHVEVEVLTTCATDYITWRNERPEGVESVHGIPVRRFPVTRERDPKDFADWSARVFGSVHSIGDELAWLESEGPTSPALIEYVRAQADAFDFFIFFSYRYYHAFHGCRAVPQKAILVPTAERDGALGLGVFAPVFRHVRALMYNSLEERALIHAVSGNQDVPGVVVGIGSDIPERPNAGRFRQKFDFRDRFAIYVGRIDENKGCKELFEFFELYSSALVDGMHLVLIGTPIIPIPKHPRIHHLGYVTDEDKFDAMAAAELLVMPSYFESLSMVALEAWALGKPVLANAACDVLHGQCLRSNAGLFYQGFQEFFETLRTLDGATPLAYALGQNGRKYFERHYSWPVIEKKYTDMLDRLKREPAKAAAIEPLPGWWGRRRRTLPAADEVVARLPRGAAAMTIDGSTNRSIADDRRSAIGDSIGRSASRRAPREPEARPASGRPSAARSSADRPSGNRPSGDQPSDDRRTGNRDSRNRQSPNRRSELPIEQSANRQQSTDRQPSIVNGPGAPRARRRPRRGRR